jgi:hypothetical protein
MTKFIRLTNAAAEQDGLPLALHVDSIHGFGPAFAGYLINGENCRLNLKDEQIAIVRETFDDIWNMIHGDAKKKKPRRKPSEGA